MAVSRLPMLMLAIQLQASCGFQQLNTLTSHRHTHTPHAFHFPGLPRSRAPQTHGPAPGLLPVGSLRHRPRHCPYPTCKAPLDGDDSAAKEIEKMKERYDKDKEEAANKVQEAQASGPMAWMEADPELKEDVKTFGVSLLIALSIRFFIAEPRYIPSLSMFPSYEIGDQLVVEKVTKLYKPLLAGDVVVFNPPRQLTEMGYEKGAMIKRIVATEGDTVEIKEGTLIVNGVSKSEGSYISEEPAYEWGPAVVPQGTVMVLGDNRNNSFDSHMWGFLPKQNVIGKAVFRYWPVNRVRPLLNPFPAQG